MSHKIDKIEVTGHYENASPPWRIARYFGPRPLIEDNSQGSGSTTLTRLAAPTARAALRLLAIVAAIVLSARLALGLLSSAILTISSTVTGR